MQKIACILLLALIIFAPPSLLRRAYLGDVELRVVQQPDGFPVYVSTDDYTLTEFSMASTMGNIGLLAESWLAGKQIAKLSVGQKIILDYGDRNEVFVVREILRYKALAPNDVYGSFVDLQTGETLDVTQAFMRVYGGVYHLTLQTCFDVDGILSGGRLFVLAYRE